MTTRPGESQAVQRLAARLVGLERQVRGLSLPSLSYSSIEGGGMDLYDEDGNLIGKVGELPDGSGGGSFPVNGLVPKAPSKPILTKIQGGLAVTWDGLFADGTSMPANFARCEIHVGSVSGFYDRSANFLKATIETPRGGTVPVVPLAIEPKFVVLVVRSTSGRYSSPSEEASLIPGSVISDEERAQIKADIEDNKAKIVTLNNDLAAANVELDAAGVKADQALTTANGKGKAYHQPTAPASGTANDIWFDTDNGHLPHKWDGTAWVSTQFGGPALATGSITAASGIIGSLDAGVITVGQMSGKRIIAGSITTDEMTANTINGDRIATNTLHAGKIVANSITTDQIKAASLTSISGVFGTISADHITTGTLSADRINGGTINGQIINGGSITGTTVTGGVVQTASGGARVRMAGDDAAHLRFYRGDGNEVLRMGAFGTISGSTDTRFQIASFLGGADFLVRAANGLTTLGGDDVATNGNEVRIAAKGSIRFNKRPFIENVGDLETVGHSHGQYMVRMSGQLGVQSGRPGWGAQSVNYVDITVNFPAAFGFQPSVVCTPSLGGDNPVTCRTLSVSTTGFTVRVQRDGSAAGIPGGVLHWHAIG